MTLCLLSSLAILGSLVGTLTAQDESLKVFASVFSGEFEAMNDTNPVNRIDIFYRDLPMLDPCDSITLIMVEFAGEQRLRVSYLLLSKEKDGFHVIAKNFTEEWLEKHPGAISQDRLNSVGLSDVQEISPCINKFKMADCPPYMGSYPDCEADGQGPGVATSIMDCSAAHLITPGTQMNLVYRKSKKGVPNRPYLRPKMDPCPPLE